MSPSRAPVASSVAHGAALSGLSFAVTALASLVVAPRMVAGLGVSGYGVLAVAAELTGYYALLDFGVRSAVIYYVARATGSEEGRTGLRQTLSSALVFLSGAGALILAGLPLLAGLLPRLVRPGELPAADVQMAIWIVVAGFAVDLPLSLASGLLTGVRRFDVSYGVAMVATVLSAVLVLAALASGMGLVGVAVAQASRLLFTWIGNWTAVLRLGYGGHFARPQLNRDALRGLLGYGGASLLINVFQLLTLQFDLILIGQVLGSAAVGRFQIGRYLGVHMLSLVSTFTMTLPPAFTHHHAASDDARLQSLVLKTSLLYGAVTSVLLGGTLAFGATFLRLWMGSAVVGGPWWDRSDTVLMFMSIAMALRCYGSVSNQFLLGTRRLRWFTVVRGVEAAATVGLSLVFLPVGVAAVAAVKVGTSFASHFLFSIPMVWHAVGLGPLGWVRQLVAPLALVAGATGAAGAGLLALAPPQSWPLFLAEAAAAGAVGLGCSWLVAVSPEDRRAAKERALRISW